MAERGDDGAVRVTSSTQHPSEVQQVVAHVLHLPANQVVVQCPRLGGGFGGKETQAAIPAALAALAAHRVGRPVRVRFNRDQDMIHHRPSPSVPGAVQGGLRRRRHVARGQN